MESATGTVVAIDDRDGTRVARVQVSMAVACPRCAQGKGCGAGLLGRRDGIRRVDVVLPRDSSLGVGDPVTVSLAPRHLLEAAVIVYGWPLLGAAVGAAAAFSAAASDVTAALATLTGLAGGAWLARRKLRQPTCLRRFTPTIGH